MLEYCGIADDAVYVAYEGTDRHLNGNPNKRPISRGVPIAKALEKESLIDPATEAGILDYLAKNYPPQANRWRAPIPPSLMPVPLEDRTSQ